MVEGMLRVCVCKRCGWEWGSRVEGGPRRCGRCKSQYWNRARRNRRRGGSVEVGKEERAEWKEEARVEVEEAKEREVVEDEYSQVEFMDLTPVQKRLAKKFAELMRRPIGSGEEFEEVAKGRGWMCGWLLR